MARVFFVLALVAVVCASSVQEQLEFRNYMKKFDKIYQTYEEYQHRYQAYQANKKYVEEFNAARDPNDPDAMYLELNKFADLTNQEYRQRYLLPEGSYKQRPAPGGVMFPTGVDLPDEVDWTDKGPVGPVQDQGQCGSCWAFGAVGGIEAAHYFATGELLKLSEQQLMDCSWSYGNQGCNGGMEDDAIQYVIDNKGIELSKTYPYTAKSSRTCLYKEANKVAQPTSYVQTIMGNETNLMESLYMHGPTVVAIDAGRASFQLYGGGVYYEPNCQNSYYSLNHCVLSVGYGVENNAEYFMVRNSWGTGWGLKGYIKMSRNRNNNCGIATDCQYVLA